MKASLKKLAINGGPKVKNTPFTEGVRYNEKEIEQVQDVFRNGRLSYWSKFKVNSFCEKVKEYMREQS